MPRYITITVGSVSIRGELFDSPCARAIAAKLPLERAFEEWGDEFYFPVGVELPLDKSATTDLAVGDIGYWPPGDALCIFFGPTPMSAGPKPVPAGHVNLVGRISGEARSFRNAKEATTIRIDASA